MDNSLENNTELADKIKNLYYKNRLWIFLLASTVLIAIASVIILKTINIKKNNLIAEKYVQAGLYLASGKDEKAKNIFEEIINSKNKFYSILAVNLIVEKNLVKEKEKIIEYFQKLEEINYSKDKSDLIKLKKALFLIKSGETKAGEDILKNLVEENSTLGKISQQILE